jgi:hypothetical protein
MMQEEFEKIAGAEISSNLYQSIEQRYRKSREDKYEFVGRIFGNENTTKSIAVKYAQFLIRENREALCRRSPSPEPERLRAMDECLIDYVTQLAKTECWGKYIKKWEFDLFKAWLNGRKAFVWEVV